MANYATTGVGYDFTFETNEFSEPRIRSDMETLKDALLFVLFSKPGAYPSIPQIGMNIQDYLYDRFDEIDVDEIKNKITEQCGILGYYIESGTIDVKKVIYKNTPSLLIYMEATEHFPAGYKKSTAGAKKYYIGLTYDELKNMIYNVNTQ